jgi:nucleoside-diphosphate kinase
LKELTFALLKPETWEKGLIGEVIRRLEKAGFKIVAMKMVKPSREKMEKIYEIHKGKDFYETLIDHMTSGPVIAIVLEKENAVRDLRRLIGATNPAEASPGTIRGDFGITMTKNIIHAADSPEVVQREIRVFFTEEEILKP